MPYLAVSGNAFFIKKGYFNIRSAVKLRFCGVLLMTNSALSYVMSHLLGEYAINKLKASAEHRVDWLSGLSNIFILGLIGFGLYALSDFIRKGDALERENELTI
jgi:hypothetical protein